MAILFIHVVLCLIPRPVAFAGSFRQKRKGPDRAGAIEKTAERPLPPPEGIGKPLGSHAAANLSGYYKIKLRDLGYRVVYGLIREGNTMKVIVISVRDDEAVYREAERRIANTQK